jgi:hypothetical protein
MLYTGVLFALSFDWGIWGVLPSHWSVLGGSIIIASTLWSALQKRHPKSPESKTVVDEESALLSAQQADIEVIHSQQIPNSRKVSPNLG